MVEIAKAFRSELSVLILDEPTASLTERETERLFALIEQAKRAGRRHHLHHPPHERDPAHRRPHHRAARRALRRDAGRGGGVGDAAGRADDRPRDQRRSSRRSATGRARRCWRSSGLTTASRQRVATSRSGCAPARSSASPGWSAPASPRWRAPASASSRSPRARCASTAQDVTGATPRADARSRLLLHAAGPARRGAGDDARRPREHRAAVARLPPFSRGLFLDRGGGEGAGARAGQAAQPAAAQHRARRSSTSPAATSRRCCWPRR